MAKNLSAMQGVEVVVWNRNVEKSTSLAEEVADVTIGNSPAEVAAECKYTFGMVSDPAAAMEIALGEHGVVKGIKEGHGYVDVSTVDDATSCAINAALVEKGARFLEAPVSGSKKPAIDGQLIFLAAGSESLFSEVEEMLGSMGKASFYLGPCGGGARAKLVVNMIMGSMMTAFCEGLELGEKAGLSRDTLLEVLDLGAMANGMFRLKGPSIIKDSFPVAFPLKHQEKDIRLAVELGQKLGQKLPVSQAARQTFKEAMESGNGDEDFAAVARALK